MGEGGKSEPTRRFFSCIQHLHFTHSAWGHTYIIVTIQGVSEGWYLVSSVILSKSLFVYVGFFLTKKRVKCTLSASNSNKTVVHWLSLLSVVKLKASTFQENLQILKTWHFSVFIHSTFLKLKDDSKCQNLVWCETQLLCVSRCTLPPNGDKWELQLGPTLKLLKSNSLDHLTLYTVDLWVLRQH